MIKSGKGNKRRGKIRTPRGKKEKKRERGKK